MAFLIVILTIIFAIIGFAIYIFPSVLAFHTKHPNKYAILGLNVLLGWTVLFWAISLIWAAKKRN